LRRIVHAAPPRCLRPLPRALKLASKRLPNNLIKLNKHVWRALSTCGHPRLGLLAKSMGEHLIRHFKCESFRSPKGGGPI
jgi:hypothetical protein